MIVPSNRLLLATAAVLLPASILTAFSSALLAVGIGVALLFLFAAGWDALTSKSCLDEIEVEAPEVVHLSKRTPGKVQLRLRSITRPFYALRIGIAFPEELKPEYEECNVDLLMSEVWHRTFWAVEAFERGKFELTDCALQTASRWGLWLIRRRIPIHTELRIYPDLRRERRRAASLFLNRGSHGGHHCRQMGKGREFEQLREYIPGDTYQDIHWKTTAKRMHPVTKVYQIEKTQEIYVVLDSSRLSARRLPIPETDQSESLLERYISAALMLAMAAEAQGDLFGLIEFGARPNLFLKAARGKAHFDSCRNTLYTLKPEEASPDFNEVISFIRTRLRKRALIVFLTSLDDEAEAERFKDSISVLSRHHLTVVNTLRPLEARPLFSGNPVASDDELYERLGGHVMWRKLHELDLFLRGVGVQFNLFDNEHLSTQLISQYMQIKQKQLI